MQLSMAGLEGFTHSVAEPGESSFECFDLSVSILCMIVKTENRKIGKSKIVKSKIGRFLQKKRKGKQTKKIKIYQGLAIGN